jgi:Flp pilus assembly protein TadB
MSPRAQHTDRPFGPPRERPLRLVIERQPMGFFAKALACVAALFLLALALVFSLIVFVVLAAVALVLMAALWWQRRQVRRVFGGPDHPA